MKKAIQKATSFVKANRIPFVAVLMTLVIALFTASCAGTEPAAKDPPKVVPATTTSTAATATQTVATGKPEATTNEQTTQPTDEVTNDSEAPTIPTSGDAVETTTTSKPSTTTTKKPTTTKAPTTTLPIVDTGEDTPKDDEVIDPLTGKPRYVVKVEEGVNGKGLKYVETHYSDGSVESIMECKYCHEMPCPDGGKEKCSHYKVENDSTKTCMYCGLPIGDGRNGTCEQLIDWDNGGTISCNHYD